MRVRLMYRHNTAGENRAKENVMHGMWGLPLDRREDGDIGCSVYDGRRKKIPATNNLLYCQAYHLFIFLSRQKHTF